VNEGKRVIDHTTAAGERGEARGSGHVITLRLTDTQTEAVKPIVQCAVEKAELVIFTVAIKVVHCGESRLRHCRNGKAGGCASFWRNRERIKTPSFKGPWLVG
jgi:hypothetical protein